MDNFCYSFTDAELERAIKSLKNNKAARQEDILNEQIKHFGPVVLAWLLELFNFCLQNKTIPNVWRQSKVVAFLKPGKTPDNPKHFRPISLLCTLFKLYERHIK